MGRTRGGARGDRRLWAEWRCQGQGWAAGLDLGPGCWGEAGRQGGAEVSLPCDGARGRSRQRGFSWGRGGAFGVFPCAASSHEAGPAKSSPPALPRPPSLLTLGLHPPAADHAQVFAEVPGEGSAGTGEGCKRGWTAARVPHAPHPATAPDIVRGSALSPFSEVCPPSAPKLPRLPTSHPEANPIQSLSY